MFCLERPVEKKTESIFQRSSFESKHKPKIIDRIQSGRNKQKKLINSLNKNHIHDDSGEDHRDVGNFVETESNGNRNNMKDYNKYSLFNTAPTFVSRMLLIPFLTYHVIL